jgi:hypothetical protein
VAHHPDLHQDTLDVIERMQRSREELKHATAIARQVIADSWDVVRKARQQIMPSQRWVATTEDEES